MVPAIINRRDRRLAWIRWFRFLAPRDHIPSGRRHTPSTIATLKTEEDTTKDTKSTKPSEDVSLDPVFHFVRLKLINSPVLMPASFM